MKSILILCGVLALPAIGAADEPINYNRDVRPILSDRCFHCHGPDEHDRQADLRLDSHSGDDGALRVIEPGSVEDSELWYRVTSDDESEVMPPPESAKPPLNDAEKEIIRRWIEQGAEHQEFWAFVPPHRPSIPDGVEGKWSLQPLDRLVLRQLSQTGLEPKPRADRRTLIRRLSLDLTGLPPTREEIHQFLADDSPAAYENLVDRLLAKPQFGEHMTKYWLDLVRFADTNGIHHDHYREMTPYRDWVIRSFNENLPYDDFVRYQLAGDLYPDPTRDQLIASGFHRLHLIIDRGTALPEESFTRNVIDRVTAVGTAFMGMTVQCAVCHDHKYDPITTQDFYQLFAYFNNIDAAPETGGRSGSDFQRGLQPPYIRLSTGEQDLQLADLDRRIQQQSASVDELKALVAQEEDDASIELAKQLKDAEQRLADLRQERAALDRTIPVAMVMKERADARPAHILIRGAYDNPGEVVSRGVPDFLPPLESRGDPSSRMDLANWFVSPQHPLTARVAVNRFWQQIFGVGIVKTSEDFGAQGEWPSHPELLDYLAVSFVESGWDVKSLVREIVTSETYRQTAQATPAEFNADAENRNLARGSRYRLDAEVIRDQFFATSGLLNDSLYGKSVKPPQPDGLWETVIMPSSYPRVYEADSGDKIYRRSVYTFWKRGMPPPQMTILNAPTREACIARRERTNTSLQALLMFNEPEYLKAARYLARQSLKDHSISAVERLTRIYETITCQLPDDEITKNMLAMVADLEKIYQAKPELARRLCEGAPRADGESHAELAAWTMLASTIYNLDITKTRY